MSPACCRLPLACARASSTMVVRTSGMNAPASSRRWSVRWSSALVADRPWTSCSSSYGSERNDIRQSHRASFFNLEGHVDDLSLRVGRCLAPDRFVLTPWGDMHPEGHNQRDAATKKAVRARLRRIAGQVRAVERMVDADRYSIDLMHQLAALQGGDRRGRSPVPRPDARDQRRPDQRRAGVQARGRGAGRGVLAQRMAGGECPMISLGSVSEPARANPGDADHDANHPGK
jgi:hypothetical protein